MDEQPPIQHDNHEESPLPDPVGEINTVRPDQIQTDNMEVHHHPDLHHKKKRLREYFLEFLMIFLAVTLGFFAEGLREHITERDRAAVFAQSLMEDFRADTITLHQLIKYTEIKINRIDSLDNHVHVTGSRIADSILYIHLVYLISTFQFDNINGTYEQIKNSGSLRFFNQSLVNNLNGYDATASKLKLMEDWENKFLYEKVIPQTQGMVNYGVFDDLRNNLPVSHEMYLKNFDKNSIDILLNQANVIKKLRARQLVQQKILLQKAELILTGLSKE